MPLTGTRLAVVGQGVLGLCVGLRAARAGAQVEIWDPAPLGANASAVAAGMIAPIGERIFDQGAPDEPVLLAGRDGWLEIAKLAPQLVLDRSGGVFVFDDHAAMVATRLRLGRRHFSVEAPGPPPYGRCKGPCLVSKEDWRVDVADALQALRNAVCAAGAQLRSEPWSADRFRPSWPTVIAAGMESLDLAGIAEELAVLKPIKGHIVRFQRPLAAGPVLRSKELYLAPQTGAILAGATMEWGRRDPHVDEQQIAALRSAALELMPDLKDVPYVGAAGIRAATPDGLPLAGPSTTPGVFLATGARRNGWLLAPLVSEIVLSYLNGGDGGPFGPLFDPRRFAPT